MHYRIDRDRAGKLSIPDGKKFDTLWQVKLVILFFMILRIRFRVSQQVSEVLLNASITHFILSEVIL